MTLAFPGGSAPHHHHKHEGERGIVVPDEPRPITREWLDETITQVLRELRDAADLLRQESRSVDEYQVQTTAVESTNSITWPAEFERVDEIITSILVTGPVSTAFTLQLGKRVWPLNTTPAGFLVIAPIRMKLNYTDIRQLSSATFGEWAVEVMGYPQFRGTRY